MKLTNLIPASPSCDLVEIENGQPVTTSLKLAALFGKNHKEVLRDIRDKILPNVSTEFNERNFAPVDYKDGKGQYRPMYYLTRDGFTMVAMGYTGPKAMQFKELYIDEFNKMEAVIQKRRPNSDDLVDLAASKITAKLFPQFMKTVSNTLSKEIVEQIRRLPQGEQLLQLPATTEPTKAVVPKAKRTYVTTYIIIVWDNDGIQLYTTKDNKRYIAFLKEITVQGKAYKVERVKTVTYK